MKKLIVLLLAVSLASCLTDKKLGEHARMYYAKHPDLFAQDCNNKFPTVVLPGIQITKSDTVITPGITVKCPDQIAVDASGNVKTTPGKTFDCPPSKTIHDTLLQHDTILPGPLLTVLTGDTAAKGQALRQTIEKLSEAEKTARNRLYWLIGLCIIFIGATAYGIKKAIS